MVIKDCAEKGVIAARALAEIGDQLKFLHHRTKAPVAVAVVQGKFY
jgi:hypothetical protein